MRQAENRVIRALPRDARARLLSRCESVTLELGEVLEEAGKRTRFVYFPVEGFVSLITIIGQRPTLEVGIVGREGVCGAHLALGVSLAPLQALVQGSGRAWRVSASAFRKELRLSLALRRSVNRYLYLAMTQIASSAACQKTHLIRPRLARWLLMTHDRARVDTFYLTHELPAYMLGIRRVGITVAAGSLRKQGIIRYTRGALTVVNRAGLEHAACTCYAQDRALYARVMH